VTLGAGSRLGVYEVSAKIGEGGMGEVYQARDTKLDRDVALKVLPEAFTADPDRLARFEREAKVLASLNHPNIGSIYGMEEADGGKSRALVLELIIFARDNALWAVPFDADRQEVTGLPVPVLEDVPVSNNSGYDQAAVAKNGTLMYLAGSLNISNRLLVWVDRDGTEEALATEPGRYAVPRVAPDGTRVAIEIFEQQAGDIWTWDFARETLTRLTFEPAIDDEPIWTPDSQRVLFGSRREGTIQVFAKAADGTGSVDRLTDHPLGIYPLAVSPDAQYVVMQTDTAEETGLKRMALEGDGVVEELLASNANERAAAFSPDGRWIAYQADESGRNEIYVRPFPDVDAGKWQVSTTGGTQPVWSPDPDRQELFYTDPASSLVAVPVRGEGATFAHVNPEVLFDGTAYVLNPNFRFYDVSPDGKRFLMIKVNSVEEAGTCLRSSSSKTGSRS